MTIEQVREQVRAALARMRDDGLSNKEIAEQLNISIPTVIRLRRGERIDVTTAAVVALLVGEQQAA